MQKEIIFSTVLNIAQELAPMNFFNIPTQNSEKSCLSCSVQVRRAGLQAPA